MGAAVAGRVRGRQRLYFRWPLLTRRRARRSLAFSMAFRRAVLLRFFVGVFILWSPGILTAFHAAYAVAV